MPVKDTVGTGHPNLLWLSHVDFEYTTAISVACWLVVHHRSLGGRLSLFKLPLSQTWKFAVLEPNANFSAGTTNCRQQISHSHILKHPENCSANILCHCFVQVQAAAGHCMWPMAVHRNCSFSAVVVIFKARRKRSIGSTAKFPVYCSALKWECCCSVKENGEIEWWCLLSL